MKFRYYALDTKGNSNLTIWKRICEMYGFGIKKIIKGIIAGMSWRQRLKKIDRLLSAACRGEDVGPGQFYDGIDTLFNLNKIKARDGEKIRVHFVFVSRAYWPSWKTFFESCRNDDRVEIKFVNVGLRAASEAMEPSDAEKFLDRLGVPYENIDSYNPAVDLPHVLVYQIPYAYANIKRYLDVRRIKRLGIRPVYIPYGIEFDKSKRSDYLQHLQCKHPLHNLAWRIYVMHDDIRKRFITYCPAGGFHVRVVGHPKMDVYASAVCKPLPVEMERLVGGRKMVMYQVHGPNNNDCRNKHSFHTLSPAQLRENIKFLQKQDDLFVIVTLHPKYFEMANKLLGMKKKEFEDIVSLIKNGGNTYFYTESHQDLVANVDAFITDNSSVMIEMGYFPKPVLYLFNPEEPVSLVGFAERIARTFYFGSGVADVDSFVQMLRSGNDPYLDKRSEIHNEIYINDDGGIGRRIEEDIINGVLKDLV